MTHDPLCGLAQPCDEEEPEHGYCSMQHGLFCIHCHQWCICNVIAKVREDMLTKFIAALPSCGCGSFHTACYRTHAIAALRALQEKP